MKTAAAITDFASKPPALSAPAPVVLADALPACWRSEAFAEDLTEMLLPTGSAGVPLQPQRLLLRALAAVLGR